MALNRLKILLLTLVLLFGVGSYLYNDFLIKRILEQEKESVELWAKAIEFNSLQVHELSGSSLGDLIDEARRNPAVPEDWIRRLRDIESSSSTLDFVTSELIIKERVVLPMVVVDEQGEVTASRYVNPEEITPALIEELARIHDPIPIRIGDPEDYRTQYVYYGESAIVRYLRYFPLIQMLLLGLLFGIGFTGYQSIVRSEQSNLWVGMTREAAHQLGTPLSGLYGWLELLKTKVGAVPSTPSDPAAPTGQTDGGDVPQILQEMEQDVDRLKAIAARFNKIGSTPQLTLMPVEPVLLDVIRYMEKRIPRNGLKLVYEAPQDPVPPTGVNEELFQWAVENLIKNGVDAMSSQKTDSQLTDSQLTVRLYQENDRLLIDVRDTGSGIEKRYWKEIFKPGFSSKKRGWGLGLTLAKRIVEEYHRGTIGVIRSEPGWGTLMRISLPIQG